MKTLILLAITTFSSITLAGIDGKEGEAPYSNFGAIEYEISYYHKGVKQDEHTRNYLLICANPKYSTEFLKLLFDMGDNFRNFKSHDRGDDGSINISGATKDGSFRNTLINLPTQAECTVKQLL